MTSPTSGPRIIRLEFRNPAALASAEAQALRLSLNSIAENGGPAEGVGWPCAVDIDTNYSMDIVEQFVSDAGGIIIEINLDTDEAKVVSI